MITVKGKDFKRNKSIFNFEKIILEDIIKNAEKAKESAERARVEANSTMKDVDNILKEAKKVSANAEEALKKAKTFFKSRNDNKF